MHNMIILRYLRKFIPQNIYSKEFLVFYFTLFYILFFITYALLQSNFEFVFYALTLFVLLNLGIYVHQRVQLPEFIVIGLSLFGFLHIVGGNLHIHGVRLYDLFFLDNLLRYDNVVHLIGSVMITLVLHVLFFYYIQDDRRIKLPLYYLSLFLMALGAGVLNEILELFAVINFHAAEEVGDYLNNAVDLVYNAVGVLLAILMIDFYNRYKNQRASIVFKVKYFFKRRLHLF